MWDDSGWCDGWYGVAAQAGAPVLDAPSGDLGGDGGTGGSGADDDGVAGVLLAVVGAAAAFAAARSYLDRTVRRRTAELARTADRLRQRLAEPRADEHRTDDLRAALADARAAGAVAVEERAELVSQLIGLRDVAGSDALGRRIDRALAQVQVAAVGGAGERFDPDRHTAVASVAPTVAHPADVVVEVVRAGYLDRDGTVLRPAEVIVAGTA
jgi:hypothetical protein